MRCSSVGIPTVRSDRPVPRLSNLAIRANEPTRRSIELVNGMSHASSTCETNPGTITTSSGPSPVT